MGVRVRLRVRISDKEVDLVALANSGFETDSPQLLVPRNFILRNSLEPLLPSNPLTLEYDTAGGPIVMHVYPYACTVKVLEEDRTSREVKADLVVSPIEKEALMSDALIEELGIVILSPRRGLWRFMDDPVDKIRVSYKPQYW